MGFYLAGHAGTRALVASFGTAGLLWLLLKSRLLQQRHGIVIAVGAISVFSVAIPFAETLVRKMDHFARTRLAAPAAPVVAATPEPVKPPTPAPVALPPPEEPVRELILPPPEPASGKLIRLKQDELVTIGGRKFRLRAGSEFPFKQFEDGRVTFVAGDEELTLDAKQVTFTGQSQETPAEVTKLAMEELRKRFPAVFEKNSPENEIFVSRTQELRVELPTFFDNPRWPLELGEQLAAQEGWKRGDMPDAAPAAAPEKAAPQPPAQPPLDAPVPIAPQQEAPPPPPAR
jgi:hypothetical protein